MIDSLKIKFDVPPDGESSMTGCKVIPADDTCRTCAGKGIVPTGHVLDTAPCTGCAGTGTRALVELMAATRELAHVEGSVYALTPEGTLDRYTEHYVAVRSAFERVEREICRLLMQEQAGERRGVSKPFTRAASDAARAAQAVDEAHPEARPRERRAPGRPWTMTETQALIADECQAVQKILLDKNMAYGNSALEPMRVFSKAPADEQIKVRLDDKLSRISRGTSAGEDVTLDLIGYLILLRVHARMHETG